MSLRKPARAASREARTFASSGWLASNDSTRADSSGVDSPEKWRASASQSCIGSSPGLPGRVFSLISTVEHAEVEQPYDRGLQTASIHPECGSRVRAQ